jgi:hypothetical protein
MRFEVSEDTPVLSIKIINPPAEFADPVDPEYQSTPAPS